MQTELAPPGRSPAATSHGLIEMSTVSPDAAAVYTPIKQTLASLRSNQEAFAGFVTEVFSDVSAMQKRLANLHHSLEQERTHVAAEREQLAKLREQLSTSNPREGTELQTKVTELEQERSTLEEELESVRSRAVGLETTLAEQKREMAEENARWSAELRQLRRTLDKQAAWITQQTENNANAWDDGSQPTQSVRGADQRTHPTSFPTGAPVRAADPVVGSILSQFEILQKDVARRREQASNGHKS
jgi:septal ring factor EnvC (AmiA/AmiB activator)